MLSKTFQHGTIYFSEIKLHLWLQTAASLPRNTHTPWRNICWIQSDKFFLFFFFFFFLEGDLSCYFLALLDYFSRAHEIEICPSSIVVRRPPSVGPSVSQLSLNLTPFKFWLLLPLSHTLGRFFEFLKKSFQTVSEFSSQWSSHNCSWDFWTFENWNFNDFFFRFP